jgi:cytochrome c553
MAAAGSADLVCGHDVITTKLTWSKEVSRVVFTRCAGCHHPEGKAFSLLKYEEARPWAKAIQEEVLRRRMPPYNAVKGFGELKHDLGLSEEEIHLLADWVEGGAPEGDVNLLPTAPKGASIAGASLAGLRTPFGGKLRLSESMTLLGVEMGPMREGLSFKLVWIEGYSSKATKVYEFAEAIVLPAGARILAYPAEGVSLNLIRGSGRRR